MEQGKYLGKIVNISNSTLYFEVENIKEQPLAVTVYSPDWKNADAVSWSAGKPLLLKSEGFFLRLTEAKDCAGYRYCGSVTNLQNGRQGRWFLKDRVIQPEPEEETKILLTHAALLAKQIKAEGMRKNLEELKSESIKLSSALEDAESIRSKSDTRFSSQQQRIEELKMQIDQEEMALRRLQSNFEIAKSVSPRGRVTSLARQMLVREFDMLTPADTGKLELLEKARTAREVLALKRQVEEMQ